MHYNDIDDTMDITDFVGASIRIPSRETLERIYLHGR